MEKKSILFNELILKNIFIANSIISPTNIILLLLGLLLIFPMTSNAMPYLYKYTGSSTNWKPSEVPQLTGDEYVSVEFTYNGDLAEPWNINNLVGPYILSFGPYTLRSNDANVIYSGFNLYESNNLGLPRVWDISLSNYSTSNPYIEIASRGLYYTLPDGTINSSCGDFVIYHYGIGENEYVEWDWGNIGCWTVTESSSPVPEPITLLLLGSGLIGLASLKKKIKK